MRLLMTHSLLNAWLYQWSDFEKYVYDNSEKTAEDYQRAAQESFLATLRREPIPTTEAMQNGIDFEELVIRIATGSSIGHGKPYIAYNPQHNSDTLDDGIGSKFIYDNPMWEKWYSAANEIAQEVRGAQFQVVATKEIEVSGLSFLLYGRLDCLKAGIISDIKFNSKYESGKYYKNPQHPTYMELVPEATRFDYLVSNGSRVWREKYTREECRPVQDIIQNFIEYLQNAGLLTLYKNLWKAKR